MSYIKVNHAKLENAARNIENSLQRQKSHLDSADKQVNNMKQSYSGEDYNAFSSQWAGVRAKGSFVTKTTNAIESYAEYLKFAAKEYKDAQSKAVNKANWIPL